MANPEVLAKSYCLYIYIFRWDPQAKTSNLDFGLIRIYNPMIIRDIKSFSVISPVHLEFCI